MQYDQGKIEITSQDEKENEIQDEKDAEAQNDAQYSNYTDANDLPFENNVFKLTDYRPKGIDVNEPENKDLLYLYSFSIAQNYSGPCKNCNNNGKEYQEIIQVYRYSQNDLSEVVLIENHPEVCFDNIPSNMLSILPCSHIFCFGCVKPTIVAKNHVRFAESQLKCLKCLELISRNLGRCQKL